MRRRVLVGLCVGVAGAVVGLVPWLLTGAGLPLQNLGTGYAAPFVLLPFSQYAVVLIAALLITGSAVAGLAARILTGARVQRLCVLLGLLAVQIASVAQAAVVTGGALERSSSASLYLAVLVLVAGLAVAIGVIVFVLVALGARAAVVVGVALASVPFESWLSGLLVSPVGTPGLAATGVAAALLPLLRWVPAVLLGAAIAWAGLRTVGRVIAAVAGLAIVWIGTAAVTAVVNTAGSRVLLRDPTALVENTRAIFGAAATTVELAVPPLVLAVVIGVVGTVVTSLVRRARRPAPGPLRGT